MKRIIYLLFAMATLGCNDKSATEKTADQEPLSHTIYSDKTELFVEFTPLVVGESTNFAAHFTVLGDSFTALSQGEVTISLILGTKGIKHTSNAPEVPGIYKLAITPSTAGTGQLIFDIRSKNFTDRIVINNVVVYPDEKSIPKHEEKASGEIAFLKEQAWKIEFANVPAKRQSFSDVIVTSGQVLSAPGDESIVTASASGIVSFSGTKNTVGTSVAKGTSLFTIAGGNMTERNVNSSFNEANANFSKAKLDYSRAQELVKDQIISRREFEEIQRNYQIALSQYNTIARNYSSKGLNITAPLTGFIKSIAVSEGQFVEAGAPLAVISKNGKLVLQANVSQNNLGKISTISEANFKSNTGDVFSTGALNGRIVSFGKSIAPGSPFVPITFEIDNPGNIISGSVVEVYLKSEPISKALVIPASSLLEEQGTFYVFVQTAGESFERREVKVGANDGQNVQILSGITDGERVVSKGAYQIKLSAASGTLPAHGHEH
ncbi:MAG TPA: efflux RND transporter periplasmic adaptor subunit [Flavobacterium sp.]